MIQAGLIKGPATQLYGRHNRLLQSKRFLSCTRNGLLCSVPFMQKKLPYTSSRFRQLCTYYLTVAFSGSSSHLKVIRSYLHLSNNSNLSSKVHFRLSSVLTMVYTQHSIPAKALREFKLGQSITITSSKTTTPPNHVIHNSRPTGNQSSSTHYLKPELNSFNLNKFNKDTLSAPPSAHLQTSRQITKSSAAPPNHADTYYDERNNLQQVVARYQIKATPEWQSPVPNSSASTKFEKLQDPFIRFFQSIGDFFARLWSGIAKKLMILLADKKGQILPSHREPSLPQLYKLVIPISGCNLEIEGCVVHSEKLQDVHYQIYRRPDITEREIKADIIFLPENPLNGPMDVSPFMAAYIHAGHRIIIPQVSGSGAHSDVGHQSRVIATVLRHLKFKDLESEKSHRLGHAYTGMETISTEIAPSLSSSLSSSSPSPGRPIFLLGLGSHAALVALSYPLEVGQPIYGSPKTVGLSGALSIPSVSARAEPPRSLMGKLNSFCYSVNSGMTGLGWWAQGSAKQARAEFKSYGPLPSIHGIIAIGPMLKPSGESSQRSVWFKKSKAVSQGIGPANYSPLMNNAIKKLHLNASNIRVPVMIAHGIKEAFSLVEGINSFYGALASEDSTLIFCPTLRHSGDLAGDAARNGLAKACIKWIGKITDSLGPKAVSPDASMETLCLPTQKGIPQSINRDASTTIVGTVASPTLTLEALTLDIESQDGRLASAPEEVNSSSDFGSWFGDDAASSGTLSRNTSNDGSIHSLNSQSASLSLGSYLYSPDLIGSMSTEIKLLNSDSPHLSSCLSTPAPRTPASEYFSFLPSSAKILDHDHGPHDVVSVIKSKRSSCQSLSCVDIPGSSLGFH
ncbi:hypothetical protein Pst134EB_028250 [Puccinia striiformis f. sp. tritici]|nr:hypothetical protein Pst134EB_028250 [Puccinia striiformis f. sp. tritici]